MPPGPDKERRKRGAIAALAKAAGRSPNPAAASRKIAEDDPRWNPHTMGNRQGSFVAKNAIGGRPVAGRTPPGGPVYRRRRKGAGR